jgi:hypothetical protein
MQPETETIATEMRRERVSSVSVTCETTPLDAAEFRNAPCKVKNPAQQIAGRDKVSPWTREQASLPPHDRCLSRAALGGLHTARHGLRRLVRDSD